MSVKRWKMVKETITYTTEDGAGRAVAFLNDGEVVTIEIYLLEQLLVTLNTSGTKDLSRLIEVSRGLLEELEKESLELEDPDKMEDAHYERMKSPVNSL